MASGFPTKLRQLRVLQFLCSICSIMLTVGSATVDLIGINGTFTFEDIESNFAPPVKSPGLCGKLYLAEPLDGCSPLKNKIDLSRNLSPPFALIARSNCSFEEKVRRAQSAGFKAVIIYDNEADRPLVKMAGNSEGIKIHAVFVSKASGKELSKFGGRDDFELWLIPSFEDEAWSIMAISFISLLAMSAVLATCFFVRRSHVRHEPPRQQAREFRGMSSRLVTAMPSLIFTAVLEDNCTSATCAICLEDYRVGDKIRVLPCHHKFHTVCVDCWLTSWRTFCPVCKRDARTSIDIEPASESTPLLSSRPSSAASSPVSSIRSYSSAIRTAPPSPNYQTCLGYGRRVPSSSMSASRSALDLMNTSARRSASRLTPSSLHSSPLGYVSPYASPPGSRYFPSPSHRSSSYVGSFSAGRPPNPLRHSGSAASFSPLASAESLPER